MPITSSHVAKLLKLLRMWSFALVPFFIIVVVFFILYRGLSVDPRDLAASGAVDKPIPTVRLSNLYQWNTFINSQDLQPVESPIGNWYLMNVWATWCTNCQNEHPFLMDLARQGIVIYGIDYRDTLKNGQDWLTKYGNPYRLVLWDGRGVGVFKWGVYSVPETFLVDPDGMIRFQQAGPLTAQLWNQQWLPFIQEQNKLRKASALSAGLS